MECYDVAHLQGTYVAGAMVVFEQGLPQKKEYRHFQIKGVSNDDFSSMQEMLTRRFKRAGVEKVARDRRQSLASALSGSREAPSSDFEATSRIEHEQERGDLELGDPEAVIAAKADYVDPDGASEGGWAVLPDLVVIDGGKGQLSAAQQVMHELGLQDVPMIALAKREEEIFRPGRSEPIVLSGRSEELRLLQRIRDEAHRFSNSYNRKLGAKRATRSKLDLVPHIGPVRKKALIKEFGTVKAIREASIAQLLAVPGMDRAAVESIKEHL